MEKKTLEQLLGLSHEDLANYVTELDKEQSTEIDKLKGDNALLKAEIEKSKKATLSFVKSATKQPTQEPTEDRFDLKDIL